MTPRHASFFCSPRWVAMLAFFLMAAGLTHTARAATASCTGGSVNIAMPNVTVSSDTPVGTLLGSAATGTATFSCSNIPTTGNPLQRASIQVFNLTPSLLVGGQAPGPSSTDITSLTFTTNIAGIGIVLTMNPAMNGYDQTPGDQQTNAYMVGSIPATGGSLVVSYTAQFVVTGAVTPGTLTAKALLPKFEWYIYGCGCTASSSASLGTSLTVNAGATVSLASCTVNSDSTTLSVGLPTMALNTFTGVGTGAGMTPFQINLTCQQGAAVFVTMTTTNADGTYPGVIDPPTRNAAKNIGVQLLYAGNSAGGSVAPTPITFGTKQSIGNADGTSFSIMYDAQYFQTGATPGAGNVNATATFSVTYQ